MLIRAIAAFLISFFLASPISYASQADKAYQSAKQGCSKLQKSQKLRKSSHNWQKAIENFEAFIDKYPKDSRVAGAMLTVGELYERLYECSNNNEDINAAIESYRTLVKKFPKSPLADDAVFRTGEIYLKHKKNREAAYIEFDKVLRKYPKGNMAAKAAGRVKVLSAKAKAEEPRKQQTTEASDTGKDYIHVNNIKYWSTPDYSRVVVYADSKVSFKETFLKEKDGDQPPRLFLDLSGSKLNRELMQPISINDGLLKAARAGQFDLNTVRVVLDIESIDSYKIFALEDPYRIVIDVSGEKREGESDQIGQIISKSDKAFKPATALVPVAKKPEPNSSLAQQLGLGIKRIVVDPGHGGHDPGAIGYGGMKEKDVVLDVGRRLRKILTEELGVEVIMTRDTDIFIPLEERTAIANTSGADLFVSLHCNASRNKKAGGIETYSLNFATDEESMRLAAKENATSMKNISDLQVILNDLMLNSKVNESSRLARYVQDSLLDILFDNGDRPKDRGVKQAPFYVLVGAQMPSILVEMSFITNKEEARKLSDEKFQRTVAESIADGVRKYSEVIKVASYQ
ncbi:MAG: N-acetylmuramoyl-L-alanine amidase [Deltaproteobacteria bacterium]|nr:N-acetylmuramoyl-L-alanine amidase [Deltaproteobacteria bacterium]